MEGISKTFKDLSNAEFRQMLENLAEDEVTDLPASKFFEALAAIDAANPQPVLELTGRVVGGELVLNEDASVPVDGNEILLGRQRVVINIEAVVPS